MKVLNQLKEKITIVNIIKLAPWIVWLIIFGIQLSIGLADPKTPPPDPPGGGT